MRIGELAQKSGVSVRSLRYYEEQGILHSERSDSGQRLYGESAVERVKLIQQLYAAGLPSKAMREIMPCIEAPMEQYASYVVQRLLQERQRIDTQLVELSEARRKLDQVISHAAVQ
ncbi:MerR family transcriptional regulator [Deinococcus oregonensis]|uniref:MerR family transcriptional regulator n=1 Tax=Deinococcus oregonensis TaxID=1805970 RepID=A0ABV6AWK8_9DEIO